MVNNNTAINKFDKYINIQKYKLKSKVQIGSRHSIQSYKLRQIFVLTLLFTLPCSQKQIFFHNIASLMLLT